MLLSIFIDHDLVRLKIEFKRILGIIIKQKLHVTNSNARIMFTIPFYGKSRIYGNKSRY